MKSVHLLVLLTVALTACGRRETRVEVGNREQILHISNGTEPEDIDPQIVTGVPEHHIITALYEGLVGEDPKDLHPVPGVAERWEVSTNGLVYTFHLRPNARWTNGERVTAPDFVRSYQRILSPTLAGDYAYMLYVMKGAEAYHKGGLKDFPAVGVKALDEGTLQITLESPTPYFVSLLNHYTWFPVPLSVIEKHGPADKRGNRWTRPGNFVGNGPFRLKEWRMNDVLVAEKNPDYWDAANVKLNAIHFYAMDSAETMERSFRAGQLHNAYTILATKIDPYKKQNPELLHISPHLASYFYRLNCVSGPTTNKLVRQALVMAIDRKSIVENVTRGGQIPATWFTPPGCGGYTARARFKEDVAGAKQKLAEAGFPDGKGLQKIEILYNTDENHRAIAEAIQEMWRKNLGIDATLVNQEWKVYLDNNRKLNYQITRAGWTGDYVDPNTFLDMFTSWSQQNQTGWKNAQYDDRIRRAAIEQDPAKRLELFQQAEEILLEELPIMPIYIYTRIYLLSPAVKGWHETILDHHPWKHVWLEGAK